MKLSSLFGTVLLIFALLTMLWAWFVGSFNCDETCSGGDWTTAKDSTEWTVIIVLGVAAFALAIALAWTAETGRRVGAWCLTLAWGGCIVPLALLLSEAHGYGSNASEYRGLTILALALAICTAFSARPEQHHDR